MVTLPVGRGGKVGVLAVQRGLWGPRLAERGLYPETCVVREKGVVLGVMSIRLPLTAAARPAVPGVWGEWRPCG